MAKGKLIGVLVLLALSVTTSGRAFKRTQVGDPIKDFSLPSVTATELALSKNLGRKATLLVFWATWSPRSAEALEDFQKLYEERQREGLRVLAVNVEHQEWNPADAQKLMAFAQEHGLTFPVVFDKDLRVFNEYGVIAVPSTVLLGPDGRVLELLEGYSHMTRDGFRERVLLTLGVSPPPTSVEAPGVGRRPAGKAARYVQMGELLLEREMPSKAERAFRRALAEDPEWGDTYRGLALALEAQGKGEEAARAREQADALSDVPNGGPDISKAVPAQEAPVGVSAGTVRYLRMGALLLHEGMLSAAEAAFRKAIEGAPASPEGYRKLAEALDAQGKGEEASEARGRAAAMESGAGRNGTPSQRKE